MRTKANCQKLLTTSVPIILCISVVTVFGKRIEPAVFNLEKISAFDVEENLRGRFLTGQRAACQDHAVTDVTVYPVFKSDNPLYGSICFTGEYGNKYSGTRYHFAIDESAGTGKGYDRLYFDLNRDLNLTNDRPINPQQNPPDGAKLDYDWVKQQTCFDYINVHLNFDSYGQRPMEIMPRLTISEKGYSSLAFITTQAHKGQIELAGKNYTAYLGHQYSINGWFDHPSTALFLIQKDNENYRPGWWGSDQLKAIHKIKGTYYCFSATPAGDKLTIQPYDGDFGTFKVGSGWRLIFNKKMSGSLMSKDKATAIGKSIERDWPKETRSCRLPVGDYLPAMLHVTLGPLYIDISENYHSDGKPRDREDVTITYGIKIRKNKPFVLNFSNKPDVIFASPAKDLRLKPGDKLDVQAVLVDPKLDIMIRGLRTKSSYVDSVLPIKLSIIILILPGIAWLMIPKLRRRYRFLPVLSVLGAVVLVGCLVALSALGPKNTSDYNKIVPRVLITRTNGEKVAEGVMPFG
ncbi:MAG: hypothetical protein JW837_12460 [Sedimentisphaerales bacterium]|nr:hypothetical protein [Sedimentisphaerales bacterium]